MALLAAVIALPIAAVGIGASLISGESETRDEQEYYDSEEENEYELRDRSAPASYRLQEMRREVAHNDVQNDVQNDVHNVHVHEPEEQPFRFTAMEDSSAMNYDELQDDLRLDNAKSITMENEYERFEYVQDVPMVEPEEDRHVHYSLHDINQQRKVLRSDLKHNHTAGLPAFKEIPYNLQERKIAEMQAHQSMVGHLDGYGPGMEGNFMRDPTLIGFQQVYRTPEPIKYTNRSDMKEMDHAYARRSRSVSSRATDTTHITSTPIVRTDNTAYPERHNDYTNVPNEIIFQKNRRIKDPNLPHRAETLGFDQTKLQYGRRDNKNRLMNIANKANEQQWKTYVPDTSDRSESRTMNANTLKSIHNKEMHALANQSVQDTSKRVFTKQTPTPFDDRSLPQKAVQSGVSSAGKSKYNNYNDVEMYRSEKGVGPALHGYSTPLRYKQNQVALPENQNEYEWSVHTSEAFKTSVQRNDEMKYATKPPQSADIAQLALSAPTVQTNKV